MGCNCDCVDRSGCITCSEFLRYTRPPEQNPWNQTQNTQIRPDGHGIRPDPVMSRSFPFSPPMKEEEASCPPCKKPRPAPPGPKLGDPGILFDDIGFPEPLGLEPFTKEICPTPEIIERNGEYEEDSEVWFSKPPPEAVQNPQYTPEYSLYATSAPTMMNNLTALSQAVGSVTNQGPDNNWMNWSGSQWDGNPIDPTTYSQSALCDWLRPTGSPYIIRGIREKFLAVNPFADLEAPTVAEINNWNVEVIKHFRDMFGNPTPIRWNARLALEARWSTERKRTTVWDAKYPGTFGSAFGPCGVGDGNIHCGESFFPDATDRALYISASPYNNDFVTYPELSPYENRYSQASGLSSTNADLPWSIKLSVIIASWICGEYLTGHPGPFVNPTSAREEVGMDWWWESGSLVNFRVKWR